MKVNLSLRLLLTIALISFSSFILKAQELNVTSNITPEEMVQLLIGTGLDYSNVVYTGDSLSRGSFWGGPGNIGIASGIILTSGHVTIAPGPNNAGGAGANVDQAGDEDLSAMASISTFDACILEKVNAPSPIPRH